VPPLAMAPPGERSEDSARPLLGWNTWLPTSRAMPRRTDANDALFESEIVEGRA
jgi:type VI secretion system protein ImpH